MSISPTNVSQHQKVSGANVFFPKTEQEMLLDKSYGQYLEIIKTKRQ